MGPQIQKIIERLGYSPNEAKVYLAALALGEAHISDIAAKTRLPRSSAQAIAEKLHKNGLLTFYVQRRYKYWVAENPERLLAMYRKREEEMASVLPELVALRKSHWGKPRNAKQESGLGAFTLMAQASEQPILIANDSPAIEYVNPAWERQFGYALEEVKGKNPRLLQSGKTPPEVYERMWKSLGEKRMFQSGDIVDKRKDGTLFSLLSTIFVLSHEDRTYYLQVLEEKEKGSRAQGIGRDFFGLGE